MSHLAILVLGLVADRILGDPDRLWAASGHPVTWFGRLIASLDAGLNDERLSPGARRGRGILALALLLAIALFAGWFLHRLAANLPLGFALEAFFVSVFLAQKGLLEHVGAVVAGQEKGLEAARLAVSRIVGRDVSALDRSGVNRAALESLAENFSDGLVAPAVWYLIAGLPGLFAYKMLNTADSMIGHRNERHEAFGYAAARLDDFANYLPARLAAGLIALAAPLVGGNTREAFKVARRDAAAHRSPNAGWPEAAMAGALAIAFGGPRRYGTLIVDGAWLNGEGKKEVGLEELRRGMRLADAAWLVLLAILAFSATLLGR
ncbi:adenosylcobinamide-phosphate synthase CbiB [Afifella sp. IM 167]|uniref:adenosylcobinamide-phosphate synthase CbiB n=1 Tax=Afifella sp. IM 167 TaxID=2033586 RepID=UPI001CC9FDDE|nr:adenosylcobinamide-phosphate synthase CbiB [Afifella sp. IM 167]MBZ8132578.1 cobalamin biosynthesis protein CobD [Afifella sp. IM 167]